MNTTPYVMHGIAKGLLGLSDKYYDIQNYNQQKQNEFNTYLEKQRLEEEQRRQEQEIQDALLKKNIKKQTSIIDEIINGKNEKTFNPMFKIPITVNRPLTTAEQLLGIQNLTYLGEKTKTNPLKTLEDLQRQKKIEDEKKVVHQLFQLKPEEFFTPQNQEIVSGLQPEHQQILKDYYTERPVESYQVEGKFVPNGDENIIYHYTRSASGKETYEPIKRIKQNKSSGNSGNGNDYEDDDLEQDYLDKLEEENLKNQIWYKENRIKGILHKDLYNVKQQQVIDKAVNFNGVVKGKIYSFWNAIKNNTKKNDDEELKKIIANNPKYYKKIYYENIRNDFLNSKLADPKAKDKIKSNALNYKALQLYGKITFNE